MSFPLDRVRAETPGVSRRTHLNNAGAALPPAVVVETVVDHLRLEADIGGYEAAAVAAARSEAVYRSVADLVGGQPDEVALVENATRAWDMAVYGYPFRPGDRVVTGRAEYASNAIALLQLRDRMGIEIVLVDDDDQGQIDLAGLEVELDRGAAMVALTHVPTNGGLVNPAAEVGARCRAHDVVFVLDACQSVGQLPVDVDALGCDVLSATGRKFLRGPRGTGFLWVRASLVDRLTPPLLDLHSAEWTSPDTFEVRADARRFESWECSHALRLGLGAAVDYALELGLDSTWPRVRAAGARLREALAEVGGVTVHDKGAERGGIVTFSLEGRPAGDVQRILAEAGVNVSTTTPGHAHFDGRGLPALVRASPHYYTTDEELDRLVDVVRRTAL